MTPSDFFAAARARISNPGPNSYSKFLCDKALQALLDLYPLALKGLDELKENRNPKIAEIECVIFIHTTWFYLNISSLMDTLSKGEKIDSIRAILPLFVDKIRDRDQITALDDYVDSFTDPYFDTEYQVEIMELVITSLDEAYRFLSMYVDDEKSAKDFTKARHLFLKAFRDYVDLPSHEQRRNHHDSLIRYYEAFCDQRSLLLERLSSLEQNLIDNDTHLTRLPFDYDFAIKMGDLVKQVDEMPMFAKKRERLDNILPDSRYDKLFKQLRVIHNLPKTPATYRHNLRLLAKGFKLAQHEPLDEDFPYRNEFAASCLCASTSFARDDDSVTIDESTDEDLDACVSTMTNLLIEIKNFTKTVKTYYKDIGVELDDRDGFFLKVDNMRKKPLVGSKASRSSKIQFLRETNVLLILLAEVSSDIKFYGNKIWIEVDREYLQSEIEPILLKKLVRELDACGNDNIALETYFEKAHKEMFEKLMKRSTPSPKATPDTTYSWMKQTWSDEVEPAFAELTKILKGQTNLSSTEIADKITSNRPIGETQYNPILKYLKSKSALEIQEALAELPAKKAKELEEILDKYHQSWSALLSLFSEVFKENGIGYSLRNAYLENKRTWEQINGEYRGVEKEESKKKNTKAFEKVKSTLNTIAEHEVSGSIVANYYKTHSQKSQAKGVCEFSGNEVHPKISITPGKSIKVNKTLYSFTASGEWKVVNKFLRSIKSGDDHSSPHYPVPLTTKEVSALKGDAKALFNAYIERQPAATKNRNKKYEPYARFKLELLK